MPGPKGRAWIDTTIRGQVDRGTGVLNNCAYNGELVWNQCSYVKDPETGNRLARPNPPDKHVAKLVPELRIVDQDLWERVKRRQQKVRTEMTGPTVGHQLNGAHRHTYLLGGTLRCGICGGAYTIIGKDRYGCATRRGKGTCDNGKTIGRQVLERRVLNGLKDGLLTPELVKGFVERFTAEIAASAKTADADKLQVERDLRDVGKCLAGVLQAVESGTWSKALSTRLAELEARQIALQSELAALSKPRLPLALPPDAASIYRGMVSDLAASLDVPELRGPASEQLRSLISAVTLTPDARKPNGLRVELSGDIAEVLGLVTRRAGTGRGRMSAQIYADYGGPLSVVAGTGFEPVTFRL